MARAPRPHLAVLAAWAALTLPALVVLRGALSGGVLFRRDVHLVWHPQVEAFVRAIAAGSWPVWDPGPIFGQPLLADPSAMVLYPLTWLNLVLRPWTYYTLFAAAHLVFAAAGARLLALRLGASPPAALAAALLFATSGPFLSLLDLWHHFAGAAWMPWVLLAADAAARTLRVSRALVWGAAMGAQILAGSADMCAMTGLIALGLLAVHAERRPLSGAHNRRLVARAVLAGGFALALSAGLWMTALDVAARSDRAALTSAVRTFWSVHPLSAAEMLTPGLWATLPLRAEVRTALFEGREPFLASLYLGLPALALVGAALAVPGPRVRVVLVAALATGALVALGRHAPFYELLVTVLPPLRILRYPVKAMVPVALAWSLLAGLGYDAWRSGRATRARWRLAVFLPVGLAALATVAGLVAFTVFADGTAARLLAPDSPAARASLRPGASRLAVSVALGAVTLGLAFARHWRPHWARGTAALLGAIAVLDLLVVHRNLQPFAPRALYTHQPPVAQALSSIPHSRVYAYDYTRGEALAHLERGETGPLARTPEGWSLEAALALAMQLHLAPATAGRWAIRTGYDLDYRGLYPHDLSQLTLLLRAVEGTPAHTELLRLGGVSHVVALHRRGMDGLQLLAEYPGLYPEPTRLFAVPSPLPRTYAVGAARVAEGAEAFRLLLSEDFSPHREVLLPSGAAIAGPGGFSGVSRVVEDAPDRVRLQATLSADGYVVLLDAYAAGWRARVDGRAVPVSRANLAFRAVAVPAGVHTIELVYRPVWMLAGLATSAAAAVVLLAAAARALARAAPATRRRGPA